MDSQRFSVRKIVFWLGFPKLLNSWQILIDSWHSTVSGVPNALPARLANSFPPHKRPGFDQIAQGMGGLMSITGAPGESPIRVGIPVADLTAGLFCATGILTALLEREVSGEGQWVQTSLLQAQIFMLDFQAAR